jgi:hypothetical protein
MICRIGVERDAITIFPKGGKDVGLAPLQIDTVVCNLRSAKTGWRVVYGQDMRPRPDERLEALSPAESGNFDAVNLQIEVLKSSKICCSPNNQVGVIRHGGRTGLEARGAPLSCFTGGKITQGQNNNQEFNRGGGRTVHELTLVPLQLPSMAGPLLMRP